MLYATTDLIQGQEIDAYLGIVFGDAVMGINAVKDLFGTMRDIFGGRSGTYERELGSARDTALAALTAQAQGLGANAIIGIDIDVQVLGASNGMLMVTASGTAVRLRGAATAPDSPAASPPASPWSR